MPNSDSNSKIIDGCANESQPTQTVYIHAARPHPLWWVIATSLAVIAGSMVLRFEGGMSRPAFAQSGVSAGAHGVFAFSGQVSKNAYGLFMVDVDAQTIWCYRFDQGGDKLKLVAGRNWNFDRYLEEHSTEPSPDFIKSQLEKKRHARQQAGGQP